MIKGKLNNFQNSLRVIPAEALFLITGLDMKELTVVNPFPGQTDDVKIDASWMTILEIICVLGHQSLLQYLLKDLQVRHNRDFCQDRHARSINQQKFVFVPILKRDE